jgi:hypothetical protein
VIQSGNKACKHSTETSLISSTDSILKAIDQTKVTAVVLLAIILLAKLENVGALFSCLTWFKSYFSERYQAIITIIIGLFKKLIATNAKLQVNT